MEECLDQKDLLNDQYLGPPPLYLHASINHPQIEDRFYACKGNDQKKPLIRPLGAIPQAHFSKNKREI